MEQQRATTRDELQTHWQQLAAPYGAATAAWTELEQAYTAATRHYHNLTHIGALLAWAAAFQSQLQHYDAVRFAIWFHDAVYDTRQSDNEERSAALAVQHLTQLQVPPAVRRAVEQMILATKKHQLPIVQFAEDAAWQADARWFLDFDLSILGSPPELYRAYSQAIRREYGWVPGWLYRRGRRQILAGFLQRERLFFTEAMHSRLETQARANLRAELAELG